MRRSCEDCGRSIKQYRRCGTCQNARFRKKNPMQYAFQNLRSNSKRRNIPFRLTFEQFKRFAIATEYIKNKGTSKNSYSIDRKDPGKGYTIDNIQVLTVSENSSKGIKKMIEWSEAAGQLKTRTLKPRPQYVPGAAW